MKRVKPVKEPTPGERIGLLSAKLDNDLRELARYRAIGSVMEFEASKAFVRDSLKAFSGPGIRGLFIGLEEIVNDTLKPNTLASALNGNEG